MSIGMKRGRVPRLITQICNMVLFAIIVGTMVFHAWNVMRAYWFEVPKGYVAIEEPYGGLLRLMKRDVHQPGHHRVYGDRYEGPYLYELGEHTVGFQLSTEIDEPLWTDARKFLKREQTPMVQVSGSLDLAISEESAAQLSRSRETFIDDLTQELKKLVSKAVPSEVEEGESPTDFAASVPLEELEEEFGFEALGITITSVEPISELAADNVVLSMDLSHRAKIVQKIPLRGYLLIAFAFFAGFIGYVAVRIFFTEMIALLILTPLHFFGIIDKSNWITPSKNKSSLSDKLGTAAAFAPLGYPGADEAGSAGGDTIEAVGDVVEGVGEALGGAGEALGGMAEEAVGGIAEGIGGCLGGLFG